MYFDFYPLELSFLELNQDSVSAQCVETEFFVFIVIYDYGNRIMSYSGDLGNSFNERQRPIDRIWVTSV